MTETSPTGRPATAPAGSGTDWIKACESGHCVKVRFNPDGRVDIGSTNSEVYLSFTADEWNAFTGGIEAGEFNHLT